MYTHKHLIVSLLLLLPAFGISQKNPLNEKDITGLWKGTLYNDSTQKNYRYEIGISEEKGKLSGFSHTFFLDGNREFYGVKKVKVKKMDGKLIIEDAGLIANNYPVAPAKGVRQLNVLTLEVKDSMMVLTGPFSTNRTKEYSSLTGTVTLTRKDDFWQSALVPHLQELGRAEELSFVKKEMDLLRETVAVNSNVKASEQARVQEMNAEEKKEKEPIQKDVIQSAEPVPETAPDVFAPKPAVKETPKVKPVTTEKPAIVKKPVKETPKKPVPVKQPVQAPPVVTEPAADIDKRTTVLQQTVYFSADSLQIALYDNGEVDGDTVSVLMNGKLFMSKAGLSTKAALKTINIEPGIDNIELVMYAENLGTIAPNTGLLVVHDGQSIYEVRFSGDLNKNASIILKRKKKE